jgi:pyruvate carboxylase
MTSVKPFSKIMVANRGEIAIRVLRAASELNLRTVAIYTYEDRHSLHRFKADESYQIGSRDEPLQPYLNIELILQTAKEQGVEAIHPGYGFLSENVRFARRCREEGIVFIGPSPEAMERVGDKVAAKKLGREIGIPLIEDSQVPLTDASIAVQEAERIGYPVMVKAASGGGGRGMRVVRDPEELVTEYEEARGEALTAFGDDTVFLEKYVENPKHVEVQLLGDNHGNLIHLYERDCSVQRRFQKVVEIAPCIGLKAETRQKLYDYAVQLGKAVNYSCAGTVEFLVDTQEEIYFIEVNPRVQVEHTITEEVTGIDIVRSQILVSMGYALSDPMVNIGGQENIQVNGCAIQCRVTTEDPANNFKPDFGTLIAYRSASGMGIRLDAGSAYPGAQISPFFDSLLVKVTAWGRTMRGSAQRLHRALREFRVRGVHTNVDFLLNLLQNETFITGEARVDFIPNHPELFELPSSPGPCHQDASVSGQGNCQWQSGCEIH